MPLIDLRLFQSNALYEDNLSLGKGGGGVKLIKQLNHPELTAYKAECFIHQPKSCSKEKLKLTSASRPKEFLLMTSFKCALSNASQRSASLCSLKGSRLNLTDPKQ
jgi:hypothetical protein